MLPQAVLWVDPGGMTGIAMLYPAAGAAPHTFFGDEAEFHPAARLIVDSCHFYGSRLAVGWERFDINAETHKKTRAGVHDALHMIGVIRYAAYQYGCRALLPAQQHTPDKDDQRMLRKLGWWLPGKDDAQSAAAHLLRWLISENELTPEQREALYSG